MQQYQILDAALPEKVGCPFQPLVICIPQMETADHSMNGDFRMDFRTITDGIDNPCMTASGDQDPR